MRSIAICVLLVLCACGDEVYVDVEDGMSREVAPEGNLRGRLGDSVTLTNVGLNNYALVEAWTADGQPIEAVLSFENTASLDLLLTAQWGVGAALFTARFRTPQTSIVLPVRGSSFRLVVSESGGASSRLAGFVAPGTAPPALAQLGVNATNIGAGLAATWLQENPNVPLTDLVIPTHARAIRVGRDGNVAFAVGANNAVIEVAAGEEMDWLPVSNSFDVVVTNRGAVAAEFIIFAEIS